MAAQGLRADLAGTRADAEFTIHLGTEPEEPETEQPEQLEFFTEWQLNGPESSS